MPYMVVKQDSKWCVFRHDADHKPVGDTLGCHPTEAEAQGQMAALYANEGKATSPNVGGGVDVSKLPDEDFVLSDSRTFPIVKPMDVSDAVSSWGRYRGPHTFEEFKRALIALCKRKGAAFVAALPQDWKDEMEGKATKAGARHSASDHKILKDIHSKAHEIVQHALDLGVTTDPPAPQTEDWSVPAAEGEQAKSADMPATTEAPIVWGAVKAAGDWELDVLGIPFGGPGNLDADKQWFDAATDLHADKYPLPPAVYYHGFGPDKRPMGNPAYIGKAVRRWVDQAGVWYRVVLDKANALAERVWLAAKNGIARASSGSVNHLIRIEETGHIKEWPVVEISIFDTGQGRQPANPYAVAVPAAKAVYQQAGIVLPDGIEDNAPKAEAKAEQALTAASDDKSTKTNTPTGDIEMEEKQINDLIASALKAQADAQAAEAQRKADEKAKIDAAVKAALEAKDTDAAKTRRLPGGAEPMQGMPYLMKYSYAIKYDSLTVADHALLIDILGNASRKGLRTAEAPSDASVRALALKCASEGAKGNAGAQQFSDALKAFGLKDNEIMHSDLSSYGSQWVGTLYSNQIWETIRAGTWVLQQLAPYSDQVPDGYSSDTVPLESTDPTWYAVAEASQLSSGRPDVTVTASMATTANKNITLAKMGCRVTWSGELAEDSLVPIVSQLRRQIEVSGQEQMEHAIIDGDTDKTITTNINMIEGTPTTQVFTLVNGFRKLALITNTGNAVSGGALDEDDYLNAVKMLGTAGISADVTKCAFIIDFPTYWKSLQLSTVKTKDVWTNATLESGVLNRIWGYPLRQSAFMHKMSAKRMANTAGKVDSTTDANNTTGSIVAVRWDQWRMKWKRRMTVETDRWIESDTNQLVAMARWGLGYRDTEASSVVYNLSV